MRIVVTLKSVLKWSAFWCEDEQRRVAALRRRLRVQRFIAEIARQHAAGGGRLNLEGEVP
jgi:hypothetical protein